MKKNLFLLNLTVLAALAQTASQGLPPLIDRELLFGDPEIAASNISPDGNYVAFLKPWKNTRNVWVKKTSEPFASAHLLTTETKRPIPTFLWTRDSKSVVFVKDNDGDENFNIYAVDPAAAPAAGADAPPARDLTGLKGVRVLLYDSPKNDPGVVYIGLNDRDKAWHDLYKLEIATGTKTLLRKNTGKVAAWFFDNKGNPKLAARVADNGDQELLRIDADGFTKVYACGIADNCGPVHYHKDGKRVYLETNKDTDRTELVLFDPESGKTETVESDPLKRVDLGGAVFSNVTDELIATVYVDDKMRRYYHNKALEADHKWLEKKFPGYEVSVTSETADESRWLISVTADKEPGEVYLFDRKTRQLTEQYKTRERLDRMWLAPMTVVRYRSSDGLEIQAYLTVPKGVPAKGLPTLIFPHGGPWARDTWGYNPYAQFFANRGYAVLMPNFRGSTGFGKKFLNAGNGEWGRKMQDDVTWGVKYLIGEGLADAKRVGIIGGSYGGYTTLAGVAFTPDVYRAAVDIVGPSNLITLLDSIPPYWEAARKIMESRMASSTTPEGKAWLKDRSPLNSADKIKTPLLVVQGANDPRVNKAEADQIVIALRDRKFPVEYLLAPDEGHGFQRPVNNMAMLLAAERFFAKYLDGRYQDGGSPEVVKRLAEITVDPATVTLAKKVDASTAGVPKPAVDLKAGTFKYAAKISAGGQEIALKLSTAISDKDGSWTVVDSMETPMGSATDTATFNKPSLTLRNRQVQQGPATIDLAVADGKMKGKMTMGGQDRPIDADLGGELFADGPGAYQILATLPLEEGYTTVFRNFDLQKQKPKLMQLKVAGSESVTVPAGTFDAYKVDITSADGGNDKTTIWVAKGTRSLVKISATMAAMGGATLNAELQK